MLRLSAGTPRRAAQPALLAQRRWPDELRCVFPDCDAVRAVTTVSRLIPDEQGGR